jgi:hypothetical protein
VLTGVSGSGRRLSTDPGLMDRGIVLENDVADFVDAFEARDEDVKVVLDLQA